MDITKQTVASPIANYSYINNVKAIFHNEDFEHGEFFVGVVIEQLEKDNVFSFSWVDFKNFDEIAPKLNELLPGIDQNLISNFNKEMNKTFPEGFLIKVEI